MSDDSNMKIYQFNNFITDKIDKELNEGKYDHVVTRFPPEPNGYLHIGHAKAVCLNFGLAKQYQERDGTRCHLRLDDTNPEVEDTEYVESIQEDIRWLGFDWGSNLFYASDYFDKFYEFAEKLIKEGKAYVCDLNEEEIREYRGTVNEPGRPSPNRTRSIEENLDLFRRMKDGEFPNGAKTLRAILDLANPNMKLRDPLLYRIRHAHHHRTGDKWCIYPMYDYAHCVSDALENITHSICTLEFDNNRALYDWFLENIGFTEPRPHQTEFARMNVSYMVTSKRKLRKLVEDGHVRGWDDPRMPTISGLRRRGVPALALRNFASEETGVSKVNSVIDIALLEYCTRQVLDESSPRLMAVVDPIEVEITNWPENHVEEREISMWPKNHPLSSSENSTRKVPLSNRIYIERSDFQENPQKGFKRFSPDQSVRMRFGYNLQCKEIIKDDTGKVVQLRVVYDPESGEGKDVAGFSPKGIIHWVDANAGHQAEFRIYDHLFQLEDIDSDPEGRSFLELLRENSEKISLGYVEPFAMTYEGSVQFERQGFFVLDIDSSDTKRIYNRTVTLKDSFSKKKKNPKASQIKSDTDQKKAKKSISTSVESRDIRSELSSEQQLEFDAMTSSKLSEQQAYLLATDIDMKKIYLEAISTGADKSLVANMITVDIKGLCKDLSNLPFSAIYIGDVAKLLSEQKITGKIAKKLLKEMLKNTDHPNKILKDKGWEAVSTHSDLEPIVKEIIDQNTSEVQRYKNGEQKLLGFFIGQAMKATKGKGNPKIVKEILVKLLQ